MTSIQKIISFFISNLRNIFYSVNIKYYVFFGLSFYTITADSQVCVELPELNGTPQLASSPVGWNAWYGTPDIITGNGNYPTGLAANIFDVDQNSSAGGEMVFLIINSANGANTESIQTTINNLTPGDEYSLAVEWQQATLDYTNYSSDFSGGKLEIFIDGILHSVFQSNGNIDDAWQTATINFIATSTSHVLGLKGELLNGSNRGAIVIDNSFCVTSPLPIELNNFKANSESNDIMLYWETVSESNNDFFIIERSLDTKTWEPIYKKLGAGNSSNRVQYAYRDISAPKQTIYYRLKQVDFDGTRFYSHIISVNNYTKNNKIYFWPNPASLQLTITGEITDNIRILNSTGHLLEFNSKIIFDDNNQITIDISTFSPGLYFIRTNHHTYKFIKQ